MAARRNKDYYAAFLIKPHYDPYVVPVPTGSPQAARTLFSAYATGYGVKEYLGAYRGPLSSAQKDALKAANKLAKKHDEDRKKLLRKLRRRR